VASLVSCTADWLGDVYSLPALLTLGGGGGLLCLLLGRLSV